VRLALPVLLAARLGEVDGSSSTIVVTRCSPDSWSTAVMSAQNAVCGLSWFAPVVA
jgi:hypothetical protein